MLTNVHWILVKRRKKIEKEHFYLLSVCKIKIKIHYTSFNMILLYIWFVNKCNRSTCLHFF